MGGVEPPMRPGRVRQVHPGSAAGLTHGYEVALLASAGLLAVALVIAVLLVRPGTRGQAD